MPWKETRKQVVIKMSDDFHKSLKVMCAKNETNMQSFIIQAIEEKVKRDELHKIRK